MTHNQKNSSGTTKECTFCNRNFLKDKTYSAKLNLNKGPYFSNLQHIEIIICKDCMLEIYENKVFICQNCKSLYLLKENDYYTSYFNDYDKFCKTCFIKNTYYKA